MPVNYNYYRIFYYVAKYRSFTRAAEILLSNQPNVTRAINNLEQELGCRLFLRSHRGVSLTPEGENLFAHVQIAQEHLQQAENTLANGKSLQSGRVSVGVSETALHGLLLPVLRQFRHKYPGVYIQITNHSTPQAIAALHSGLVELAVITTPAEVGKPLRQTALKDFEEVLVAGPDYADLADRVLSLEEVARYPIVSLSRESGTYGLYNRWFARRGLVWRPDIEVATADQILPMVKSDLGLGFMPDILASEALEKGEVYQIRLAEPVLQRQICMVKDQSRPQGTAARELEAMIRREAAV